MTASLRDGLLLAVYCAVIFFLSHQSTLPMPLAFPHQDKLSHLLAYAVMAVLAWHTFSHHLSSCRAVALVTVVFCSLYGMSDEFHQSFVAGRNSEVADWLADTLGAAIATVAMIRYQQRRNDPAREV
ncbi:MAG: VanZ family protein [Zetaproteobacteria bacterium]|nr:VanZ family protein [Zetaproteobacteria bacterium]